MPKRASAAKRGKKALPLAKRFLPRFAADAPWASFLRMMPQSLHHIATSIAERLCGSVTLWFVFFEFALLQ